MGRGSRVSSRVAVAARAAFRFGRRRGIPSDRRASRAFTLVELLVAVAISSLVVLATCAVSSTGWRLWRRVEDRRAFDQQAGAVIDALRVELAGAYLPGGEQGGGLAWVYRSDRARGEQMLSFCTTSPAYRYGGKPGRCARVTYEYRRLAGSEGAGSASGDGVLIRREQMLAGEEAIAEPEAEVIARNLKSCTIECLGPDGRPRNESPPRADAVPATVKVRLAWETRGRAGEPSAVITHLVLLPVLVNGTLSEDEAVN